MKKLLLFTLMLVISISCSKEDNNLKPLDLSVNNITGTWQLTETYLSPGGETEWQEIENGPTYNFKSNGSFTYSEGDCTSGNFEILNENLKLSCHGSSEVYSYFIHKLDSSQMEISIVGCKEACVYRYQKQ
ncbi:lipocalin family protein [Gramella sp. KN1008]|uniref:lipocalin family protein n=1 Tax=Gramella sp. KN1008 TaxID=2529298 RepID=UPI00103C1178|nr:lipocalin family protein [Gramella sp. KN1008]TBW28577.1 hypothetical protein EZJ28_07515 [Gramella sp. KN1008]